MIGVCRSPSWCFVREVSVSHFIFYILSLEWELNSNSYVKVCLCLNLGCWVNGRFDVTCTSIFLSFKRIIQLGIACNVFSFIINKL